MVEDTSLHRSGLACSIFAQVSQRRMHCLAMGLSSIKKKVFEKTVGKTVGKTVEKTVEKTVKQTVVMAVMTKVTEVTKATKT